jgi:hypothetical protein
MKKTVEALLKVQIFLDERDSSLTDESKVLDWIKVNLNESDQFHVYSVMCTKARIPFSRELVQKHGWDVTELLASNLWVQLISQRIQL